MHAKIQNKLGIFLSLILLNICNGKRIYIINEKRKSFLLLLHKKYHERDPILRHGKYVIVRVLMQNNYVKG